MSLSNLQSTIDDLQSGGCRLLERYREFLPINERTPLLTLNEGNTPLIAAPRMAAGQREVAASWSASQVDAGRGRWRAERRAPHQFVHGQCQHRVPRTGHAGRDQQRMLRPAMCAAPPAAWSPPFAGMASDTGAPIGSWRRIHDRGAAAPPDEPLPGSTGKGGEGHELRERGADPRYRQ